MYCIQTCKWHSNRSEKFGNVWKKGDVVGCLIDLDQQTMGMLYDVILVISHLKDYIDRTILHVLLYHCLLSLQYLHTMVDHCKT